MRNIDDEKHESSLVQLALERRLPRHQFMDTTTVDWIESNSPFKEFSEPFRLEPAQAATLVANIPAPEWFLHPQAPDSIHGIRHLSRVGVCALALSNFQGFAPHRISNVIAAAVLHDVRRVHDQDDPSHGSRAATWIREHVRMLSIRIGREFTDHDLNEICAAVTFHDLTYQSFETSPLYAEFKDAIDTVKTADAMDRYRLPKLKWWFNPIAVRLRPIDTFLQAAFTLVVNSERAFLAGSNSIDAVFSQILLQSI